MHKDSTDDNRLETTQRQLAFVSEDEGLCWRTCDKLNASGEYNRKWTVQPFWEEETPTVKKVQVTMTAEHWELLQEALADAIDGLNYVDDVPEDEKEEGDDENEELRNKYREITWEAREL